jgi:lipopolysaccharide export system permease protein
MRLPRTLSAYALGEVLQYTLLGLLALSTLLVGRNLLRHLDDLIRAGSSAGEIGVVVACLATSLATYALPVAFLFGVLLSIGRLAGDAEIVALQSCGVGLRSLVLPIAVLGLAIAGLTAFLTSDVEHRAQRRLRLTVQTLVAKGRLIEPGQFQRVGERVLFAKARDEAERLRGVLIADRSMPDHPMLIFAARGETKWDPDLGMLHLELNDGTIHFDTDTDTNGDVAALPGVGANARATVAPADAGVASDAYRRISFRTFDYAIAADEMLGVSLAAHRPREMSNAQLRSAIARAEAGDPLDDLRRHDPVYYRLQLQRRLALPFAPILFALIGVPLAVGPARRGRSWGILLCALTAFGYYLLLTLGQSLAHDGAIPAASAAWLPNGVFAGLAWILLRRTTRIGAIR